MLKYSLSLIWLALLLLLVQCEPSPQSQRAKEWMQSNGKLKVLSTTGMVADIVSGVGGPYIDNLTLISEQLDPHSYQLVKGDDEKFKRAHVIFYSGLNLEHGPSLQSILTSDSRATALGDAIRERQPDKLLAVNGQLDPHIWMDISLWAEALPAVVAALSRADPTHSAEYEANGAKLSAAMLKTHSELFAQLQAIPPGKRFLVTSHDAFNYFARAYLAEEQELIEGTWKKRFAAPEGLAPDSQLSTTDIQAIIRHLDRYHILVVFPESNVSQDSLRKIVDAALQKGLKLTLATEPLYGDAMGPKGSEADSYLKMLKSNAATIARYLNANGEEARLRALLNRYE